MEYFFNLYETDLWKGGILQSRAVNSIDSGKRQDAAEQSSSWME